MRIAALAGWTIEQRSVVVASFLGWTLDAFDFFLLVFVLKDIAQEFDTDISDVTFAILLTLAMRPLGAFLFGRAADRWGRRPTLMVDVLLYSILEFASGFSPNLTVLLVLRAVSSPVCSSQATRQGISSPRSCTGCCFRSLDGAACSWSVCCRRCSCCTSAGACRNHRVGNPGLPRAAAQCRLSGRIGVLVFMRCC